ncbi:PREDICTED: probable carboxylesterase 120 [Nelumbo nucifera]|uniref:Probable carboxylesterase 120 n=1 Tax=Nelumbo nucifera TaxID=4432 RepID=A0A1U8Q8W8_NELNU|nr:PREDICTED: probable carboxylesterase 120 [Nelumbo nucifera]
MELTAAAFRIKTGLDRVTAAAFTAHQCLLPVVHLPVSIYFHGGGMILNGPDTIFCHEFCENFIRFGPAILVSVAYCLAPEHRLPVAYKDGEDALLCGGNTAYNVRLRSLDMDLALVKIQGTILDQPLFGGIEQIDSEVEFADDRILPLSVTDLIWELALPLDADRDHEYCTPMVRGSHNAKIGSIGRVIV